MSNLDRKGGSWYAPLERPRTEKKKRRAKSTWLWIGLPVLVLLLIVGTSLAFAGTGSTSPGAMPKDWNEYLEDFYQSSQSDALETSIERTVLEQPFTLSLAKPGEQELSLQELYAACADSIVGITAYPEDQDGYYWGTGVIADEAGLIVTNAHKIVRGEAPELTAKDRDFFFLRRRDPAAAVRTIQELCQTRLPKNMGIAPADIQVLSPSRKHETGTKALNLALQAVLNPPADGKKEKKHGDFSFRIGDRVMQIRNNYDIMWKRADGLGAGTGIFNGDIGTVTDISFQDETMTVQFDDRTAEYAFDMLSELEPAYAMTVHKSQGSAYRAVILSLCGGPQMLLTRSVLYTAITRARELLIIVGNEETVAAMTRNDRRQRRYSGLKLRLEGKA